MGRGGKRKGAGRPIGTGKFGEPTKAVRLPISLIDHVMDFVAHKGLVYPMQKQSQSVKSLAVDPRKGEMATVAAGLPESYGSTVLVCVEEEGMVGAGIHPGDILVVNYGVSPQQDDIVVAVIDGKTVVRWYSEKAKGVDLIPDASGKHPTFKLASIEELPFCGVVTKVVRDYYA